MMKLGGGRCGWKGNLDAGGERLVAVDCGEEKTAWEEVVIEVVGYIEGSEEKWFRTVLFKCKYWW